MHVAVVGASDNRHRYSYKAFHILKEQGHRVYPVNPNHTNIEGDIVYPNLASIPTAIDTITLYVNPQTSNTLTEDLIKVQPQRVIFNPGSENHLLESALNKAGIDTLQACTLVLLHTGQF